MLYFYVALSVLFLYFLSAILKKYNVKLGKKTLIKANKDDCSKSIIFVVPIIVILVVVTGLRNSMGTDYDTYKYIYQNTIKNMNFYNLIRSREFLFALAQKIVGIVSDYNIVALMTFIAIITVLALTNCFYNDSEYLWLSFFMLLTVGSYYTCFNTTRNYLAAALFAYASKFIYERNFPKFFIAMLIISNIHLSAVFLIVLYWVLPFNIYKKRRILVLCSIIIILALLYSKMEQFSMFFAARFFSTYLDSASQTSGSLIGLIRPAAFSIFVLVNIKKFDLNNSKHLCWINGVLLFLVVQILSLKFSIVYRYAYYFIPYALLAIPYIIKQYKRNIQRLLIAVVIVSCLLYGFIGQFKVPYSFYWQQNVLYFG
mgnify:CR=1 FL=1